VKRILGMVVATATLLAFSSLATAALVHIDTSGAGTSNSRSGDAATTGPCPLGMSNQCFIYPFATGSSVDLDITGSAVTLISAATHIVAFAPLVFGTINLSTDSVGTITGATGTLVGNDIVWTTAAASTVVGTLICNGPNCGLLSMTEAFVYPIQLLNVLANSTSVNPIVLGTWSLNAAHTAIVASSVAIGAISNAPQSIPPADDLRGQGTVWGATSLGNPAPYALLPEPASATLVLLGLGALALRKRGPAA